MAPTVAISCVDLVRVGGDVLASKRRNSLPSKVKTSIQWYYNHESKRWFSEGYLTIKTCTSLAIFSLDMHQNKISSCILSFIGYLGNFLKQNKALMKN